MRIRAFLTTVLAVAALAISATPALAAAPPLDVGGTSFAIPRPDLNGDFRQGLVLAPIGDGALLVGGVRLHNPDSPTRKVASAAGIIPSRPFEVVPELRTWFLNGRTLAWHQGPNLLFTVNNPNVMQTADGRVIVGPGCGSYCGVAVTQTQVLSRDGRSWQRGPDAPANGRTWRMRDGRIVLFTTSGAYQLSPAVDGWRKVADFYFAPFTQMPGGDIFGFAGGRPAFLSGTSFKLEPVADLPDREGLGPTAAALDDARLLVTGTDRRTYVFDRRTGTWAAGAKTGARHDRGPAVSLPGGSALVMGGAYFYPPRCQPIPCEPSQEDSLKQVRSLEFFNGRFNFVPDLPEEQALAPVELHNASVLIIGDDTLTLYSPPGIADMVNPQSRIETGKARDINPHRIYGTTRDTGSGVRSVSVRFSNATLGYVYDVKATLQCDEPFRRVCTWTAKPMALGVPGAWTASASAIDRAGNVERQRKEPTRLVA